jgi:hypothetical protein
MSEDMYCVKEKKTTPTENITMKVTVNGRNMMQGICTSCGTKKTKFVSSQKGSGMGVRPIRPMVMMPEDYEKLEMRLNKQ